MSAKVAWNLSVNAEVKRQMLIYCAANNQEISELTERLYVDFLNANRIREADLRWPSDAPEKSPVVIPKTPLDLQLKEVELQDGKEELQMLNREITLATPTIRAIMRDDELVAMMPPETRIEMERFAEIYV